MTLQSQPPGDPHLLFHVLGHVDASCIPVLRLVSSQFRELTDAVGVRAAAPRTPARNGGRNLLATFASLEALSLRRLPPAGDDAACLQRLAHTLLQLRRLQSIEVPNVRWLPALLLAAELGEGPPPGGVAPPPLRHLSLGECSADAFAQVAQWSHLESLHIHCFVDRCPGVAPLLQLQQLQALSLEDSRLGDAAFEGLAPLPHLASLDLSGNRALGDAAMRWAAACGGGGRLLRALRLEECCADADGGAMRRLTALTALQSLDLSAAFDAADRDSLAALLASLPGLRSLSLSSSVLASHEALRAVHAMPALTQLRVKAFLAVPLATPLADLPSLTDLDLSWHGQLTDHQLAVLLEGRAPLRRLSMAYCGRLGPLTLTAVALFAATLTSLDLLGCLDSAAAAGRSPAEGFPLHPLRLHHLAALRGLRELKVCGDMPDLAWLGHLTALTHLTLRRCHPSRSALGLACLAHLPRLASLILSHSRLAAEHLALVGRLPALQELSLACCAALGDDALSALRPADRLARLDLRHCTALGCAGVRALLEALGRLHTVYVDPVVAVMMTDAEGDARFVGCTKQEVPLLV